LKKSAFVTGANRGIGRAIALRLAASGYNLFLVARDLEALEHVAEECRTADVQVTCLAGELTEEGYIERALEQAFQNYAHIDVLINNAGVANHQSVQDADLMAWHELMDINFHAVVRLSRRVLPSMIARRAGAIINISSLSGRSTSAASAAYCASKFALNGFSECMYEDVREFGIKVSTLMPGFVETDLTQNLGMKVDRMIKPDDIADAVEFILATSPSCCPTEVVLRPQRRP